MSVNRFLMLLALVVWLGGIIFFAFVLAPTAFAVLPTRHLAGNVVSHALPILHWMGIVSGVVFLATSMIHSYFATGFPAPMAARHILVYLMILLTLVAQFAVISRMDSLRTQMGMIDEVAPGDMRRIEFDHLHEWATRLEGAILALGLGVLYLTARRST